MNSKLIIAIVIVILLLGGGAFVMSNKNKVSAPTTTSQDSQEAQNQETSEKTSLKDLLLAGVPQKCTYAGASGDLDSSGTSYISGGKVRVDYTATVEGTASNGHMIYDGATSYIWTEGQNTGFKMAIDKDTFDAPDNVESQAADFNEQVDYNCSPWVPDSSQFTPPANVTFTEFSIPSISGMDGPGTGNQDLCKYCDSMTGEQKTQCLTSLKCN